ncbi:MAG: nucleotidyltransferase family protein [Blastocatellia bacterium]|nr:nucleotidyltransferase family protein [Blastocatellia bacterium]
MSQLHHPTIHLVLLAAGRSSRLGTPKQLFIWEHESLLRRMVRLTRQVEQTASLVVIGAEAVRMRTELENLPVHILENLNWREGMGSSIRTAVEFLTGQQSSVEAVMFLTCDQPLVTTALLQTLIATYRTTGKGIVACGYAETIGVPALFHARYFSALGTLQGDRGAKKIIAAHPQDVAVIPFPDGEIDLDTQEAVERFLASRRG